jgi:hypothetical protein
MISSVKNKSQNFDSLYPINENFIENSNSKSINSIFEINEDPNLNEIPNLKYNESEQKGL